MKKMSTIAVDAVPVIFDDRCLKEIASVGKLPSEADFSRFARSVRGAVRHYALAARAPSSNDLHHEIKALHRAADREQCDEVANLLDRLTVAARAWLDERGRRPSWQSIYGDEGAKLPIANDVRDPAKRREACGLVRQLCTVGGGIIEGRLRPTGRRSRPTYRTALCAPNPSPHFARREAELDLVTSLQISFVEATSRMPALTAHHDSPGPFARMAQKVLVLVGATHADAVGLINELNRRRREMERRAPPGSLGAW